MSSPEIRAAARALVEGPGWPASIPHRETVEQEPDEGRPNLDTQPGWSTLAFNGQTDEAIGVGPGAPWRETGSILFLIFAQGIAGDAALMGYASAARDAILAHPWGAAGVYVAAVSPPIEADADDDAWAAVALRVDYERDHAP